jgi:vacuolar-type H+-ATPase subunit E/Vma4
MQRAEAQEAADDRLRDILEHVQYMADNLSAESYFQVLEGLVDSARRYLRDIEDPELRRDLRKMYQEVINYAFELKLNRVH